MADVSAIPLSLASWCSFALVFCLCFVFPMQAWPQLQGMQYTTMDCLSKDSISWTQSILSVESVQIWRLLWCLTFYRHTCCLRSFQQHKESPLVLGFHNPGPLQDCWDLHPVCTVQEHHKVVGRLTFCLETVARCSMFFWRLSCVADDPLGPVKEILHLTVLYTGE